MYIWEVELEENWSYENKSEFSNYHGVITISARNSDQALRKASGIVMKKSFKDEEGTTCKVREVRLLRLERKQKIDA
jgi:hypothetical protein